MDATKHCKECKCEKVLEEFFPSKVHTLATGEVRTYYSSRCKPCHSKQTRRAERKVRDANLLRIWRYLEENPCTVCGETNPIMLSFDHRDPGKKVASLADMMTRPWPEVQKELAKCDVLCHNHHAVKTAAQRDWFKAHELRDYVESWPENKKMYERYAA